MVLVSILLLNFRLSSPEIGNPGVLATSWDLYFLISSWFRVPLSPRFARKVSSTVASVKLQKSKP